MTTMPVTGLVEALGAIGGGCFILTHDERPGKPRAILLSFVQQVGFQPPRIIAAIRKDRPIVAALERRQDFVLNVCAAGDDALLDRFANPNNYAEKWFEHVPARRVTAGWLLEGAAAYLVCSVKQRVDAGDHWLYIADVLDGARRGEIMPLVRVRSSGLDY